MSINIVKRLRELGDWEVGDVKSDAIYHAAANEIERLQEAHETVSKIVDGMTLQFVERGKEIERLNTMMNQHAAEDTEQFYGLHATIRENQEIIKLLCDHIEYLGYFIDEEFQSNEPNYKYAHFVEVVNHIRDWSKDLKKDLA